MQQPTRIPLPFIGLLGAAVVAMAAGVSAHVVTGVLNPTLATAFVSSPSATEDPPLAIKWGLRDTRLRVVCFFAANTSAPRADAPDWPRVIGVGFELPGTLSGFSLLDPIDDEWTLAEGLTAAIPGRGKVTLDFAVVTPANPSALVSKHHQALKGLPPGQPPGRGSGTRFCVSGPFPDSWPDLLNPGQLVATTIERIINGAVVNFQNVEGRGPSWDLGLWDSPLRSVPLYQP